MNRIQSRIFISAVSFLFLVSLILPSVSCSRNSGKEKPNIVLILVDDMGWTDLGCYAEDDFHETPSIDRMASEGLRFTNGYASCAVCSPTRASIMSGLYPARLQITDWIPGHSTGNDTHITPKYRYELPLETVTLAEKLKMAGYDTYHVGKWHLGESEQYWPQHQGFDVNSGGHAKGAPGSYYFPYAKLSEETEWTNLNLPPDGVEGDYLTDFLTDSALSLMEESAVADTPFFLNMCYYTVHTPQEGKPELNDKYRKKLEGGQYEKKNIDYASMVQSLDENVGRILEKLDELGLAENTLVILSSDNGSLAGGRFNGSAPLRDGKGTHYEGGIRVPYIFRWPGKVTAGAISDEVVISPDLYPTILEVAAVEPGAEIADDSLSLASLFDNSGSGLERDAVFWHYPHYHRGQPVSVIRSGSYKLMEFLEEGNCELYNLETDIGEEVNLAEKEPEKTVELLEMLHQWKADVGAAPLLDRTPETEKLARKGSGWIGSNNIKNPPVLRKTEDNLVEFYTFNEAEIFYTLDGSDPDRNSARYKSALDMRDGGLIKVRSWSPDGQVSDIEEFIFKAPRDLWEISLSPPDSPRSPELAVDSERGTFWEAGVSAESPLNLVIDMGEKREIRGFTYQPARREFLGTIERNTLEDTTHGAVNEYRLLGSEDGETWKVLAEGQFKYRKYAFLDSKRIDFPETVSCRYLKFTAISSINEGETVNVEDLSVY
jgi:arylsulfatase A